MRIVEQGEELLEIVATDSVYVVGEVPEAQAGRVPATREAAAVEAPGLDRALPAGKLVSVAPGLSTRRPAR